jgi:membrane protease YdiL (CAAX protease family)
MKQTWLLRDIFYVLLAYAIVAVLISYIENQILGLTLGRNMSPCVFIINRVMFAAVFTIVPMFIVARYYEAVPADIGLTLQGFRRNIVLGIVVGLLLLGIISLADQGITSLFGDGRDSLRVKMLKESKDTFNYIVLSFSAVILAPISEEIFCRGFTYTILKKRFGKIVGVVVSSLLFAGLHFDIWNAFYLFIMGVGLTLLFEKTNSLVPGIIAHTAINLSTVCLILVS